CLSLDSTSPKSLTPNFHPILSLLPSVSLSVYEGVVNAMSFLSLSAERVASEGDDLPTDSFVFAELSDSQCGVIPPELATCENLPFGSLAGDGGVAKETDPSVPSKEDIPTFDEWKKQVMEVEKEKSQSLHTSTSSSSHQVKKVPNKFKNNYASVECGAKILSANSEAKSTSAILKENMDLYMLNPCSTKIWFVIELCEPIQVKQLDIANFELFSSTPKDFLVSLSDRYPTNKWVKLGTFHAHDQRTVQSFPLDEQLYAKYVKMFIKYIKVELLSHFGSEHFCPLSLIRVFGTSMVEEYEEISDSQDPSERGEFLDEDYDYPPGYQPSEDKASKNLLGSATSMRRLMHIVTLVEQEEEEDEEEERSTVMLMPDESEEEEETMEEQGRKDADRNQWESQTYCPFSAFSSLSLSCMATLPELLHRWCSARVAKERLRSVRRRNHSRASNSSAAISPSLALVPTPSQELLPVTEAPLELEAQTEGTANDILAVQINDTHAPDVGLLLEPSQTSSIPPHSFSESHSSNTRPTPTNEDKQLPPVKDAALDSLPAPPVQVVSIPETQPASRATPTPTLHSTPQSLASEAPSSAFVPSAKEQPVQPLPSASRPEDSISPPTELPVPFPSADTDAEKSDQSSQSQGEHVDPVSQNGEAHHDHTVEDELLSSVHNGNGHRSATDFYAELQNGGDYNSGTVSGKGGAVHGSSQKESVFMRLNNRIKALEMNMSLSSRYLEELSQRYRKQMEEMQRAFNKTIIKLQNTSRIAEEQDQKQTESIQILQSQLENVTKLMLNLTVTVGHLQREVSDRQSYLVVSLVLCLFLGLLLSLQCCRSSSPNPITSTVALPKSNHYPSPKRCFSSYDDMSIKRRVACPLVRSKSFHLSSTEVGPDDLYIVEPLRFSPEKKVQCLFSLSLLDEVSLLPPCPTTESPSESSSCSSSLSGESYTSRLPPPSPVLPPNGLCNGHSLSFSLNQPPKSRQEKRSLKRRKSKQTELPFPSLPTGGVGSLPNLQTLMKGNKDISVGTIGVTAVTGHV
uniref:SUN domain-containing ossification factor n=1 Tax=Neogobius melanostomus TaxID=47308 RepID=A0A8C6TDH4_9GOBI